MTADMRRMLREEVEELTAKLREDPQWADLRRLCPRHRIHAADAFMASLREDEDGTEFGVLVTADRRVIEYRRRIASHRRGLRVLEWSDRTDDPEIIADFPQVGIALEMLDA